MLTEPLKGIVERLRCEETRWDAILELKILVAPDMMEPLIALLEDTDWVVRWCVAEKLGDLKDVSSIGPLSALLNDSDLHVRKTAIKALSKFGVEAIPNLVKLYSHPNLDVRQKMDAVIRGFGKEGLPYLEAAIPEQNWVSANRVVDTLWRVGGPDAEDYLIRALKYPDVQKNVIVRLGAIKSRRAVRPLCRLYSVPSLRRLILYAYTKIGKKKLLPILIKGLHGEGWGDYPNAHKILIRLGKPILPQLVKAIQIKAAPRIKLLKIIERIGILPVVPQLKDLCQKDKDIQKIVGPSLAKLRKI